MQDGLLPHLRQQCGERPFQPGILTDKLRNAAGFGSNGFDRSIETVSQKVSIPTIRR